MINAFHFREHFPALRQLSEIAYQHEIPHRTVQCGKHSRSAYDLEYGINDAASYVFLRGIAVRLSEQGSGGRYRQVG